MPPLPPPVGPFSCPACLSPASAAATPQICSHCRLPFVLRAGVRVDPAVTPPPVDRSLPSIKAKSAGLVLLKSSIVAPDGVLQGTLDPVTGLIPMDQEGIPFGDIVSIAIWRKLDIVKLVFLALLALPITLGLLWASVYVPILLILSLPVALATGISGYHALGIRRNYARVTGSQRSVTMQFDTPMRRRLQFHGELLRRAGLTPSVIP